MSNQLIIGICGVSQSGKSTLTRSLKKELSSRRLSVKTFEMDHYTVEKELIPKIKDRLDWEHPDSIDWERLVKQVEKSTADVVLVEGIFAFDRRMLPFYSKKILIEVDKSTFYERRNKEIRWGEEPDWYLDHVWESNQKLVNASPPDVRLNYNGTDNLEKVMSRIERDL